jgi:hypothetical protein
MGLSCATRLLKNARFLQAEVGFIPRPEPLDGYQSVVPPGLLSKLDRVSLEEVGIEKLAKLLAKKRPATPGTRLSAPLFSGTLRFVQFTLISGGTAFSVADADLSVALQYATVTAAPISAYASQYGPNRLAVANATIPLRVSVASGKYNDSILSGWVDQLAKAQGLGPDSCLVFLNPQGVVNSDADPTQGVLGYHNVSAAGVPYAFVNVMGQGLTLSDQQDAYALALSHEIAEMTVDPRADGSNPEVCDECAGNCNVDYRNYFGANGAWLGGSPTGGYAFFIDGIATPASVAKCPAPQSACSYPPPGKASKS